MIFNWFPLAAVVLVQYVGGFRHFGMPKLYARQQARPIPTIAKCNPLKTSLLSSTLIERDDLRNIAIIGKFSLHLVRSVCDRPFTQLFSPF